MTDETAEHHDAPRDPVYKIKLAETPTGDDHRDPGDEDPGDE